MKEDQKALAAWKAWADDVERISEGQWLRLYASLAPQLNAALDNVSRRSHVVCPLPQHRSDGKNFRALPDVAKRGHVICTCTDSASLRGMSVLMRLHGWRYSEAVDAVADVLGCARGNARCPASRNVSTTALSEPVYSVEDAKDDARRADALCRVWNHTVALDHPSAEPARAYLRRRNLTPQNQMADVRFIASLGYMSEDEGKSVHPALISLVRNGRDERLNLHRTYLTPDGFKARVATPKKLMSRPSLLSAEGMAIRLDHPTRMLNVAEGLESALAVRLITGAPTWATVSAAGLRNLVVPDGVEVVLVWADHDRSGEGLRSADVAIERVRAQGRRGTILPPPFPIPAGEKTVDWADVLSDLGLDGVRRLSFAARLARQLQQQDLEVPALIAHTA